MKPERGIVPDEHLRTALRHAPDAEVAAPADISAQIIAAAHRSAAERATPPTPAPVARDRWWLQAWGASGALATVLMAGFIGLMWRGEAPGPALEVAAPQIAQAPTPAPSPARSTSAATTPATADMQTPPPSPAAATRTAATNPRVIPAAPTVKPSAKAAAQAMAPEPGETVASARDAAAGTAAAPPAPASPAAAAAPRPTAEAANQRAMQRAAQEQSAAAPPHAPAPAAAPAAMARLRAAAAPSVAPQPPWRTTPQPGDSFSWQPADSMRPPDAAWLARLADLSAGRWEPLSAAPATAEDTQLHWQRGGATVARFGFERSSVWWCSPLAACERAPLGAATVRDLLTQLAR